MICGVTTARPGRPVAVGVYPGNGADPGTVPDRVGEHLPEDRCRYGRFSDRRDKKAIVRETALDGGVDYPDQRTGAGLIG